mgnify:CR=1 FL=1
MNSALWTDNKDSSVFTPDPALTKAAIDAQTDIPKIVPYFVQNYLGPNGKPNTMTTDIDSGLQITQKVMLSLISFQIKRILYISHR